MSFYLEYKKARRTGFVPAFIGTGIVAAAVPVLNMTVRSELYMGIERSPVQILLDANWQMMAMLNILLVTAGTCMIYHTEYADNAILKMYALPIRESRLFFGKAALTAVMCGIVLAVEMIGIAFSVHHWFSFTRISKIELLRTYGYALLLSFPVILAALFIASVCRNMWISLGIGVVCVFIATLLPTDHFALSLFPFALPFQTCAGIPASTVRNFAIAAMTEIMGLTAIMLISIRVRRAFL